MSGIKTHSNGIANMDKDQLRQFNQVKWSFISGMKDKCLGKLA
jgi:hypothetical protein